MRLLPLLAALLLASPARAVVIIEWVEVGDPGNAPDTASNCDAAECGSVAHRYLIASYEVTNVQYVEFLNAKAVADPADSTTRTWRARRSEASCAAAARATTGTR